MQISSAIVSSICAAIPTIFFVIWVEAGELMRGARSDDGSSRDCKAALRYWVDTFPQPIQIFQLCQWDLQQQDLSQHRQLPPSPRSFIPSTFSPSPFSHFNINSASGPGGCMGQLSGFSVEALQLCAPAFIIQQAPTVANCASQTQLYNCTCLPFILKLSLKMGL